MTTLAGTSVIQRFMDFFSQEATAARADSWSVDDAQAELDALAALAIAAFEELIELTQRAVKEHGSDRLQADPSVVSSVRQSFAKYHTACQPLLGLISRGRALGAEPRRLDEFMRALGEAELIAHRYDHVVRAEREADAGNTKSLSEIRDELRCRVHGRGE